MTVCSRDVCYAEVVARDNREYDDQYMVGCMLSVLREAKLHTRAQLTRVRAGLLLPIVLR